MSGGARVSLPGLRSPGAGFDEPFAMLDACHDRVRRSLDLLQRLRAYLQDTGCDDSARQAARDVLRYFDLAAPLHHEDEELHVFPPLLAAGDAQVREVVLQLQRDHVAMAGRWTAARGALLALAEGLQDTFTPGQEQALEDFAQGYDEHLRHEDLAVYPAAQALLDQERLQAMGQEMAQRRGATVQLSKK
ncbi:Hemerythrin-like domain-containing protein [Oryzisolibacter propanilivorax]|uniref:Hemerythrin-like domain-containing protein n=1 Tax=Oryzisolibacter propanilivorax TaxID=1527607 RepID=A0A1G9SAS3_9BURK|nr:hemerythrin domain-containing protein [Oryzisolibacter propanilivorax]SDM32578.1 Hemerythrin-like domain-containing protein [Oryzisolibacter propanilivorax]